MKPLLQATHITKFFHDPVEVKVLNDVSFDLQKSEFVSIVGKSGCGKSTLLYILSTMDSDYSGELEIDGERMSGRTSTELAHVRNEKIGFVFQFHYLLNDFSVLKNVMLPALKLNRWSQEEVEHRALGKLDLLGMKDMALKGAHQLSGGQKQRVAIARALINEPLIIMCDEPTGNLDKKNSQIVFELFHDISKSLGQTLLVVTHDNEFAAGTDRVVVMEDGRIKS